MTTKNQRRRAAQSRRQVSETAANERRLQSRSTETASLVGASSTPSSAATAQVVPAGSLAVRAPASAPHHVPLSAPKDVPLLQQSAVAVLDAPTRPEVTPSVSPTPTVPMSEVEPRRRGEVVTVFSPKGGVGTSFIATNLATALCDHGTVCLLDLDLEFGDIAIMTGLSPSRGIIDAVGQDLADDAVLNRLITGSRTGPDCVLAPVDPAAAEQVSAELVANLMSRLRARFDYVVVDTPSQLSEHVLEALDASAHHVLVTTPDLAALKNLRLMLDTLDLLGLDPARCSVVLNRHAASTGLQPPEVEAAIRTTVSSVIRLSEDVPVSIDEGQPLLGRTPRHPVSKSIRSFADTTIVGVHAGTGRRPFRFGSRTRTRSE